LIGFSGGLGSTVLLDLVSRCYISSNETVENVDGNSKPRGGSKHPRNQSVWNEARACYVEICGAFPESGVRSVDLYQPRHILNETPWKIIDAR
jgi:cytoplasmic tRNA 2-thiolation protein 2